MFNDVYIWAGTKAKMLIGARFGGTPSMKIETVTQILDQLQACITHATKLREAREEFYTLRQRTDENVIAFYGRILELHKVIELPDSSKFLIADRLIHGCLDPMCMRKLMNKNKDARPSAER
ncbi:hypothetical protein CAPTEDRAFT_199248 [Capitella teleta]|uniref:Retrotransposon gag domain-containing protein n=1 Tax=Capitella teleta TaxID=283909 RepID=R7UJ21_CAPTE|nr:hypothetical protein CAPTEDRAFT_199248 [Capitella teleta]|eukprot:ELU03803.1 hypothetical protein CAPTEDRAFT_199248 [Capitella teleta]